MSDEAEDCPAATFYEPADYGWTPSLARAYRALEALEEFARLTGGGEDATDEKRAVDQADREEAMRDVE